jgi:hypothetical protein
MAISILVTFKVTDIVKLVICIMLFGIRSTSLFVMIMVAL